MEQIQSLPEQLPAALTLASGQDRFGEFRDPGISPLTFKVTGAESTGLFIAGNILHTKGGPARHIHHNQDEWFYIRQGEFLIEVGQERFMLKPGDSPGAPRKVPHVWAYLGGTGRSILFAFNAPGKMESFFHELARLNNVASPDPELWRAHELEWVGPPLDVQA